jgi:hypothetical protein
MSDDLLKKITITVVALIGFAIWTFSHAGRHDQSPSNSPTELSARRR